MFRPNFSCKLYRVAGRNGFGERAFGPANTVACAVVDFKPGIVKTSVRADSSASRGKAEELAGDATLLFLPSVAIAVNDKIEVYGATLHVILVEPRYDVAGGYDHNQVTFAVNPAS